MIIVVVIIIIIMINIMIKADLPPAGRDQRAWVEALVSCAYII